MHVVSCVHTRVCVFMYVTGTSIITVVCVRVPHQQCHMYWFSWLNFRCYFKSWKHYSHVVTRGITIEGNDVTISGGCGYDKV
jgi:hypothetical protein